MTAEELRKVSGGVVGHFTPKELTVEAKDLVVGDNAIGLKVPVKKFIYGAYIKNDQDDLASDGAATVAVAIDGNAIISAKGISDLKGKGAAVLETAPAYKAGEAEVKLTVATAAYTAGKLIVGVIYG